MKPAFTDEEVIRQYQSTQSTQCLNALYDRYATKIYGQCLRMTQDAETSKDFTHDIFIKVFTKLSAFQHRARFSSWLYSITYHYCLDQIRQAGRLLVSSWPPGTEWDQTDSKEALLYEESMQALNSALMRLLPRERRLLILKYRQGLSLTQLADLYGLNVGVIKMRLQRSRRKAQRLYAQQRTEHPDFSWMDAYS